MKKLVLVAGLVAAIFISATPQPSSAGMFDRAMVWAAWKWKAIQDWAAGPVESTLISTGARADPPPPKDDDQSGVVSGKTWDISE